jgi:hypothetical protein
VLRPVFACLWIEQGIGAVPTEFHKLFETIVTDKDLKREIDALLAAKKEGQELRKGPRNEIISSFTEQQILRLNGSGQRTAATTDPSALNRLFVDILKEVNGSSIA